MTTSPSPAIEPHYTPPQIASGLHVDPATVRGWIKNGELRARKLGGGMKRPRYRVPLSALEDFLRSREVNARKPQQRKQRKKSTEVDYVAMMHLESHKTNATRAP